MYGQGIDEMHDLGTGLSSARSLRAVQKKNEAFERPESGPRVKCP